MATSPEPEPSGEDGVDPSPTGSEPTPISESAPNVANLHDASADPLVQTATSGGPVAVNPPTVNPPIDDFGRIADATLLCTVCAESLLGTEADGVCSSCRTPAGRSIDGDRLKYADAGWLKQTASGITMVIGSIFATIAIGCLSVGLTLGAMVSGSTAAPPGWLAIIQLLVAALFAAGLWQSTAPEPKRPHVVDPLSRSIAHFGAPISFAMLGLQTIALQAGSGVLNGLGPVRMILTTVILFAALRYATRIGQRIPDQKFTRFAKVMLIASAVAITFFVVSTIAIAVAMTVAGIPLVPGPEGQPPSIDADDMPFSVASMAMIYSCSILLLAPLWFIAMMILLFTTRDRVLKAAADAQQYAQVPHHQARSL